MPIATSATLSERVDILDWGALRGQLDERGFAVTTEVLDAGECGELADLADERVDERFRRLGVSRRSRVRGPSGASPLRGL